MPVFARDILHTSAAGYGALMGINGVGALSGALLVGRLGARQDRGRILFLVNLVFAGILVGFALSRWLELSAILLFLIGASQTLLMALTNTLIQLIVPDEFRGRVMALYTLIPMGLMPLGTMALGGIGDLFRCASHGRGRRIGCARLHAGRSPALSRGLPARLTFAIRLGSQFCSHGRELPLTHDAEHDRAADWCATQETLQIGRRPHGCAIQAHDHVTRSQSGSLRWTPDDDLADRDASRPCSTVFRNEAPWHALELTDDP
jgi:hypothetical protein